MQTRIVNMNIGCVVYKKNPDTGNLTADWRFAADDKLVTGTGEAQGKPGAGFAGEYSITYYNQQGSDAGTFDLHIEENRSGYSLSWFHQGQKKYTGCGMMHDGMLIAGWKKADLVPRMSTG